MLRRSTVARGLAAAFLFIVAACASREAPVAVPDGGSGDALRLDAVDFADFEGWSSDDHGAALATFLISCDALERRDSSAAMGGEDVFGTVGDWLGACQMARRSDPAAARLFFEAAFQPWRASSAGDTSGLFTGYYEPLLEAALAPDARYAFPLYRQPDDMVSVDLGLFSDELADRNVTGRIVDGVLVPYHDRAAIDGGALAGHGLEIAWVDDPVALFFLHIQGSGRLHLADGRELRVGYDGQNGRSYYAIGRELVARGELTSDEVSLQSIRDWLKAHPGEADAVMATNPSYIFFRLQDGPGPIGAQGVPLTAGRSMAVDRRLIAYGTPLWLDTTLPDGRPWRHLMIAQDTGGAIRGAVRGDIFFGAGSEAEWLAGHMKGRGGYVVLLPRGLAPAP